MRVLVLGAGASRASGYPLASELIPEIERAAQQTRNGQLRDDWECWEAFRATSAGPLKLLAYNKNPEVVLSLVDLYEAARDSTDWYQFAQAKAAWTRTGSEADKTEEFKQYQEYFDSSEREGLSQAVVARAAFLRCLHSFFSYRHYEDSTDENRERRDYLRTLLAGLSLGDRIITLNWDTTVERSLPELGRWNPMDGYGFPKTLSIQPRPWEKPEPVPVGIAPPSAILVLKLHGSFGWHRSPSGRLYFDKSYFLNHFRFSFVDVPGSLADPDEPEIGPPEEQELAYPSFLKQVRGPELQAVWHRASDAVVRARCVDIFGYSLPESDAAVRVLLNPLRYRLDEREVRVRVHEPYSKEVQARWREFLPGAEVDEQKMG